MTTQTLHESVFKAVDDEEQLVYGEVYAPNTPDSDGDIMDADTIKKMAHDFLKTKKLNQIDVQHDNNLNPGASVVESFIARKGDPIFIEGSWVVGMHIPDDATWAKIKKGEINGFSIEALVTKTPMELIVDIPPVVNGLTTKSEDHEHEFFVTFDPNGKFLGGRTNVVKGHSHSIRGGTCTDIEHGHNHKFSFVEAYKQVEAPTVTSALATSLGIAKEELVETVTKWTPEAEAKIAAMRRDKAASSFAGAAHDSWREGFQKSEAAAGRDANAPRMRDRGGVQVNLNVPSTEAHPNVMADNVEAGKAAHDAVIAHPNNVEAQSDHIHKEWMKRNPKNDDNAHQHVDYKDLSEPEKQKDRDQAIQMQGIHEKMGVSKKASSELVAQKECAEPIAEAPVVDEAKQKKTRDTVKAIVKSVLNANEAGVPLEEALTYALANA